LYIAINILKFLTGFGLMMGRVGKGGEGRESGVERGEKKWGEGGFLCASSSSLISLSARFSPQNRLSYPFFSYFICAR
jgi:hypothetical protein